MRTEEDIRRDIEQTEDEAIKNISIYMDAIGSLIVSLPLVRLYIFSKNPFPIKATSPISKQIAREIDAVLSLINGVIRSKSLKSWTLGEELTRASLFLKVPKNVLESQKMAGVFLHREKVAESFLNRSVNGLRLSDRVWNLKDGIQTQIESTLQLAVYEGKSANETALLLKKYLRNPNVLFKKVRDNEGDLVLSPRAKNFHSYQGVYKSSYANAHRLARNEINNAYRRAHWEQIQDVDFIVGCRIKLSNNHPIPDICNELQGDYPKSFRWHGWHVSCRCRMITILKTDAEIKADTERIANGYEPTTESVNMVKTLPEGIQEWAVKNKAKYKPDVVDWIEENPQLKKIFTKKIEA